jgi:cyclin-dependent kinase 9
VVTLWYRPPELLLGERNYNSAIDMWGAGCIMAELWTRSPIMQGNTEQHQIALISQLCGTIDTTVWPNVDKLDLFTKINLPQGQKRRVVERMKPYVKDQYAVDLLDRLLTLDPKNRMDSDEALNHDFFWTDPLPTQLNLDKHLKNMYELTAPPRRPQARPHPQQPPQQKPIINTQHFDRVY